MSIINEKISELLSKPSIMQLNLDLSIQPTYDHILNLWNYHKVTNKRYRHSYNRPAYNPDFIRKIIKYRYYYSDNVKQIFDAHVSCPDDNLLLIYIKDEDKFLILLKINNYEKDRKNPFISAILPLQNVTLNNDILDVKEKRVVIRIYKNKITT